MPLTLITADGERPVPGDVEKWEHGCSFAPLVGWQGHYDLPTLDPDVRVGQRVRLRKEGGEVFDYLALRLDVIYEKGVPHPAPTGTRVSVTSDGPPVEGGA